ncbi:MAG: lytic transglycosylase domain-containing protein [Desulfobaccales bacterium]
MWRSGSFAVIVGMLVLLQAAGGAADTPVASREGSLVLAGKEDSGLTSRDRLSVLLSKEVEVYIFKHKTRVWPQAVFRPGGYSRPVTPPPHLETLIQKYSRQYGVDPALVRAVIRHESGFNPQAVSPKGAQGLMQLMPGTADLMGVRNPFDPEQNIMGGVGYLRYCLDRFGHNVPLAVAAYNAGPERVAKTGAIPPIPETQTFVHNVVGTYQGLSQSGGTLSAPPAAPSGKGAKMLNAKGAPIKVAATPSLSGSEEEAKPRRPKPKIIEVRFPAKKSRN